MLAASCVTGLSFVNGTKLTSQKGLMNFLNRAQRLKTTIHKSIIEGSIAFHNVGYTYEDTNIQALKISFSVKRKVKH
jgi:hypothetical protein